MPRQQMKADMSKHDPLDLTANLLGDEEAERREEMVKRVVESEQHYSVGTKKREGV